jgi:transcriptional regulator with XRE-family HTH domain
MGYGATMPDVIDMLVKARRDVGVTQRELAERIGVRNTTVGAWEKRQNDVPWTRLNQWARALGVEIDLVARDPRPGGEVEMTDTQRQALRAFAELLPDLSDEAALDLVGMARHLARRDP